jgi:hypothetical protein
MFGLHESTPQLVPGGFLYRKTGQGFCQAAPFVIASDLYSLNKSFNFIYKFKDIILKNKFIFKIMP